jgi:transposase InsO family protein
VLWLASVRDAFFNKVVGWAAGAGADTDLVLTALGHALRSRSVHDGQLIHHSDYAELCVKPRDRGMACAGRVALSDFSA